MLMHSTEVSDHCIRMVPLIGSCCTSIILKGPWERLASLPKYGLPMSRWMRTLSLRQNSFGMHLQFSALAADCDWACLRLLMAYQLVAKEVGRIMSWLNASWAGLAFKVVLNLVLMAHITGMRSSCWADTVSRSWVMRQMECRRRQILSHCHVNNQLGGGSNRARLGWGSKWWWCFPCVAMPQFSWNVHLDQWL